MSNAFIRSTHEGYIVCWLDERCHAIPMRNFGDWEGAAMEFRDWMNQWASLEKVHALIQSYDPSKRYEYPVIRDHKLKELPRQRNYND